MKINIGELGIKNMYEYYKQHTPNPLSYKDYKRVNDLYAQLVIEDILAGENYKIPLRLGYLRIRKYKTDYTKLAKDYKTSKELGITVYHLNEHSDGYRSKFLWEKKRVILKKDTKRPYSFIASRDVKRRMAKEMQKVGGHKKYPEEILSNQKYKPL